MSREHFHDLTDRLGMSNMSTQIPLPQVFIHGQLLGVSGTDWIQELYHLHLI